jgi:hypothetical protein
VSDRTPSFDDLVGADVPQAERDRLRSVHDLLVQAGPPPEVPPSLERAPSTDDTRGTVIRLPRRYRYTVIAGAAAAALVIFGIGYGIGSREAPEPPVQTIAMTGVGGATGSIDLMASDAAGNWPMILHVRELPRLPVGKTYTLWLTRDKKLVESCGTFVSDGSADVPLNAPYRLRTFDGWVVVRTGAKTPKLWTT